MAADRAQKAKDKGNKLFKEGKLAESVQLYKEAEKIDSENPVYPSNLSAALYELGHYADCMNAILRSWSLKPEPSMGLKLSTRLAKTLSHGLQDGSINTSAIQQNADAIKELENISLKDQSENAQAWTLWRILRAGLEHHEDLSYEAKVRLSKMPIYKGMPDPRLTYWIFGTDEIISLVDNWGPDSKDPINLRALNKDQFSQLSFLLAGVGDARHAFGTIIGLGKAHEKLNAAQKKEMKVHLTLLDIHFATIARDLILFLFIDALMADNLDEETRLEIQATLIYTYIGWVMPSYCYTRLMSICEDTKSRLLESPPRLPNWIHVDKSSIKPVIRALDYWLNETSKTASGFLEHLTYVSGADKMKQMMSMNIPGFDPMASYREEAQRQLDRLSDQRLLEIVGGPNDTTRDLVVLRKTNKKKFIDMLVDIRLDKNIEFKLADEAVWFRDVHAFLPPAGLVDRHPEFEYFREMVGNRAVQHPKCKQIGKSVLRSWKPNITILDGTQEGYMDMEFDAFGIVQLVAFFNRENGLETDDMTAKFQWPAFSHMATFFDGVIDTIKALEGRFQLELICDEINQQLSKVRLGTDSRPEEFPKKFTRIWLSNIPDFTHGTLNTAVYILPALQDNIDSAVTSNCMFNSPVWKSDDEFCYNYTLLLPKDLEKYLGIRTLNGRAVHDVLTLAPSPLPRPLAALASREQLHAWLSRLLLSLVTPGKAQVRPNTIKMPNNLVAFIGLLVELRYIGYPSHWISDFLQAALNGTLQADHLTYKDNLPRPVQELRQKTSLHRVRLDPWYAEFEMILASSRHGLPFALYLPEGSAANHEDVGLFKASVTPNMLFSSMFKLPVNDNVIAILFYKNAAELRSRSIDYFLSTLPGVVDGETHPPPGTFHMFTSQDFVDLTKREVRWRMSKALAAKMRRDRWSMVLWRMDFYAQTTEPCPASRWQNVDSPI